VWKIEKYQKRGTGLGYPIDVLGGGQKNWDKEQLHRSRRDRRSAGSGEEGRGKKKLDLERERITEKVSLRT